ncbi:PREDICTED: uncharacterized protein LOC108779298 [Cyphomyrmex costatus]|uniref:uncharacterized protein LOC108779298 n=1 Tax=Cyphomyrmex costatus TaxID=456900 RepID=UPI0008523337|nr:PREDICTED: uncharacterized protein LOC108779298 [Cyphomyrmex costatus]
MIFSDNGRQFVSKKFANFCKNNGINHRTSTPYHPAINGLAENAVGNFKRGLLKALADKRNASVEFVEREKAREKQVRYFKENREIEFEPGKMVYVRDYKCPTKPTWRKAIIKNKLGVRTYLCRTLDAEGLVWKRHTDQIVKAGEFYSKEEAYLMQKEEGKDLKESKIVKEPESEGKQVVIQKEDEAKISIAKRKIVRAMQNVQDELKVLKQRRTTLKSQCTRFQTYVDAVDIQSVSIIELRARLQRFTPCWNEFNGIQGRIEALDNSDQSEMNQEEERESFEGKYDECTAFRNMFHSMIHQNAALPDVQKMQYLVSALKDEAYDVISSLEPSAENYREAWQMLNERYDDPSLIISKHVKALFDLPHMSKDNHVVLRKLLDTVVKHIRALKALKRPIEHWDDLMLHIVTTRLDHATAREWETTIDRGSIPSFKQLITFLTQRCRALEASSRDQHSKIASEKSSQNKKIAAHVVTTKNGCAYCHLENHSIYKCKDFLALQVDQRIKEAKTRKMCLNCLKSASSQRLLSRVSEAGTKPSESSEENSKTASISCTSVKEAQQVLLATAIINVQDATGKIKSVRALLDNGSQSCFITGNCCKELGLKLQSISVPIYGLAQQQTQVRNSAKVMIQSRITGFKRTLDCLVIERITQDLPCSMVDRVGLHIPKNIPLADPQVDKPSSIDMLLGAEIFFELLAVGTIKSAKSQPTWQNTLLGWIISGNCTSASQLSKGSVCSIATTDPLNKALTKFWQIESCERKDTRTPEECSCEDHFMKTHKRDQHGRFVVSLLVKEHMMKRLGNSKEIAIQIFKSLERRFKRDPQLKVEYSKFIHEYLALGHMREFTNSVDNVWPHFYMPHHCVIKTASSTSKLRRCIGRSRWMLNKHHYKE